MLKVQFCAATSPYGSAEEFKAKITDAEKEAAKAAYIAKLVAEGVDVTKIVVVATGIDVTEGCSATNGRRLQVGTKTFSATFNYQISGPSLVTLPVSTSPCTHSCVCVRELGTVHRPPACCDLLFRRVVCIPWTPMT